MNLSKWASHMGPTFLFLGFLVNFHRMIVEWPIVKRRELHAIISEVVTRGKCQYKEAASIVGKIRSAADVSPWGIFIVWALSNELSALISKAPGLARFRGFWARTLKISKATLRDLCLLRDTLLADDCLHLWERPIGLLIPRTPHSTFLSDASYGGVGGWSLEAALMWRITSATLSAFHFEMKRLDALRDEPLDPSQPGLHINPLELVGLTINVWLAIRFYMTFPHLPAGRVIAFLVDNTSALAWFRIAATCKCVAARNLSRFVSSLHLFAATQHTRLQASHLPGRLNDEADYLSRSIAKHYPSWDCVIAQNSLLETCRVCLLPSGLLSLMAELILSPSHVVVSETQMTEVMSLALHILPLGSHATAPESSIY
jgi:hypothetical protein